MFTELMPLLAERTVLITVARESDTTIRLGLVPKRTRDGENAALTTPLILVGTPEELDRELPRTVTEYVETHRGLSTTLAQAKAEMETAAKAAQEEARRKSEERRKAKNSSSPSSESNSQAAQAQTKPASTPPGTTLFGGTPSGPVQSQQQGGLRL
jgi:PRTRC genetic system protein E